MMIVYLILGIIIVGSFVSGVVLIVKDNKTNGVEEDNKQLYDDPKTLFEDLSDDTLATKDEVNVDNSAVDNFDDEII